MPKHTGPSLRHMGAAFNDPPEDTERCDCGCPADECTCDLAFEWDDRAPDEAEMYL